MEAETARAGLTGGCQCGAAPCRLDAVPDLPSRQFSNPFVPAHLGNRRRPDHDT
jgi:hypothetical protein